MMRHKGKLVGWSACLVSTGQAKEDKKAMCGRLDSTGHCRGLGSDCGKT